MKSLYMSIAVISMVSAFGGTAAARSPNAASPQASAQSTSAPTIVRIDGELKTPTGVARTGTVVMVASLYAGKNDATPLWVEQQLITLDQAGRYTIFVGATLDDGLPKEFFLSGTSGSGHWLGVAVQGEAEQPRVMLVSVPYALKAREADTLAGKTATDFVLSENLNDSVKSALKTESVRNATPSIPSTSNALAKFTDSNGSVGNSAIVEVDGNIGVGTTNPAARFDLSASANNHISQRILNSNGGSNASSAIVFGNDADPAGLGALEAFSSTTVASGRKQPNGVSLYGAGTGGVAISAVDASGVIRFLAGGSIERVRINSSGNVGIGTINPGALLDLSVSTNNNIAQRILNSNSGSNASSAIVFGNDADPAGLGALEAFSSTTVASGRKQPNGVSLYGEGTGGVTISAVDASGFIRFLAGGSIERVRVTSSGNVGIGTTNPSTKLDVAGDVTVTGNIAAKYQDVAEWVETPAPLEPGTVVIVDPLKPNRVLPAPRAYDTRVAGAVSRQPGLLLGERSDTKAMVAQSGRVRVKADARYGAIKIGDLLVTSPTPGYAMRSRPMRVGGQALHRPGTLLGKALEALPSGKGEILVLLTLQ